MVFFGRRRPGRVSVQSMMRVTSSIRKKRQQCEPPRTYSKPRPHVRGFASRTTVGRAKRPSERSLLQVRKLLTLKVDWSVLVVFIASRSAPTFTLLKWQGFGVILLRLLTASHNRAPFALHLVLSSAPPG